MQLSRTSLDTCERRLLNRGRFANATVWAVGEWVVKDFRPCPWILRWTVGLWMAGREYRVLRRLDGMAGVPTGAFRIDRLAFGYRFVSGRTLRSCPDGSVGADFFLRLEAAVRAMHARGIAHLDLRNARNILITEDGAPALIDFQSALPTGRLPSSWRRSLERIDLSGVCKHWARHAPASMGAEREASFLWQMRQRRWWRLRGYRVSLRKRPVRDYEKALLERTAGTKPGR